MNDKMDYERRDAMLDVVRRQYGASPAAPAAEPREGRDFRETFGLGPGEESGDTDTRQGDAGDRPQAGVNRSPAEARHNAVTDGKHAIPSLPASPTLAAAQPRPSEPGLLSPKRITGVPSTPTPLPERTPFVVPHRPDSRSTPDYRAGWDAGWDARQMHVAPQTTWRGRCGHLWDRAVEDTDGCPRCAADSAPPASEGLTVERITRAYRTMRGDYPGIEHDAAALLAALADTDRVDPALGQ